MSVNRAKYQETTPQRTTSLTSNDNNNNNKNEVESGLKKPTKKHYFKDNNEKKSSSSNNSSKSSANVNSIDTNYSHGSLTNLPSHSTSKDIQKAFLKMKGKESSSSKKSLFNDHFAKVKPDEMPNFQSPESWFRIKPPTKRAVKTVGSRRKKGNESSLFARHSWPDSKTTVHSGDIPHWKPLEAAVEAAEVKEKLKKEKEKQKATSLQQFLSTTKAVKKQALKDYAFHSLDPSKETQEENNKNNKDDFFYLLVDINQETLEQSRTSDVSSKVSSQGSSPIMASVAQLHPVMATPPLTVSAKCVENDHKNKEPMVMTNQDYIEKNDVGSIIEFHEAPRAPDVSLAEIRWQYYKNGAHHRVVDSDKKLPDLPNEAVNVEGKANKGSKEKKFKKESKEKQEMSPSERRYAFYKQYGPENNSTDNTTDTSTSNSSTSTEKEKEILKKQRDVFEIRKSRDFQSPRDPPPIPSQEIQDTWREARLSRGSRISRGSRGSTTSTDVGRSNTESTKKSDLFSGTKRSTASSTRHSIRSTVSATNRPEVPPIPVASLSSSNIATTASFSSAKHNNYDNKPSTHTAGATLRASLLPENKHLPITEAYFASLTRKPTRSLTEHITSTTTPSTTLSSFQRHSFSAFPERHSLGAVGQTIDLQHPTHASANASVATLANTATSNSNPPSKELSSPNTILMPKRSSNGIVCSTNVTNKEEIVLQGSPGKTAQRVWNFDKDSKAQDINISATKPQNGAVPTVAVNIITDKEGFCQTTTTQSGAMYTFNIHADIYSTAKFTFNIY